MISATFSEAPSLTTLSPRVYLLMFRSKLGFMLVLADPLPFPTLALLVNLKTEPPLSYNLT